MFLCLVKDYSQGFQPPLINSDHVVCHLLWSGYYVASSHPPDMAHRTVEDLTAEMTSEILTGVKGTDVRCGHIGEIGCSWPLQGKQYYTSPFQHESEAIPTS